MASESSDRSTASVAVPAGMEEWLDAKAAELDVDRDTLVVQLLAAYRAAEELDDRDVTALFDGDIEDEVRDVVVDRIPDIASAVGERIDADAGAGAGDADEDLAARDDLDAVEDRLASELDRVETDFREKLEDVRTRVVQVKRETDAKAPADHSHEEFDELAALSEDLGSLESRLADLGEAVETREREHASLEDRVERLEGVADRLDDVEEKLQTVAWVVSDLRDAVDAGSRGSDAVDQLKRAAAEADVERAVCDSCEKPVDIALLTEPNCPHCGAVVTDVELPGGFFGKPRLTVAQQLEAGDAAGDDGNPNVPDAARRE